MSIDEHLHPMIELTLPPELIEEVARRAAAIVAEDGLGQTHDDDRWMDTRRAADYAGCSVNALHKAMARREVLFQQDVPGGKAWFRRSDIDTWRRGAI